MPNVVTHGLMALDVYNRLDDLEIKRIIAKYPKAYLLGSNGPDILFYSNALPWQNQEKAKEVSRYGDIVHRENINEFYKQAIALIAKVKNQERKDILSAYLAGHLMHWSLDVIAHPFIFYRSGKMADETRYWHYRYESMIDSLMVIYVKRRDINRLKAYRFVDVSSKERRIIASFYQRLLTGVFNIDLEATVVEDSIASAKTLLKILYDPRNIKTLALRRIEKLMNQEWAFTSHVVSSRIDAQHDVLNLKHDPWLNPTDDREVFTQSFIDLYDEATDLGVKAMVALDRIFAEGSGILDGILENRQYDTGRADGKEMKFFKSIY